MSFAFMLTKGWWSDDFETFWITEVDINRGDVSAVNYGANPFTSIAARQRQILEDIDRLPDNLAAEVLRRLQDRPHMVDTAAEAVRQGGPSGRSITHIEALLES